MQHRDTKVHNPSMKDDISENKIALIAEVQRRLRYVLFEANYSEEQKALIVRSFFQALEEAE